MIIKAGDYTCIPIETFIPQRELPLGWVEVKEVTGVFVNPDTNRIVITGRPNEEDETHSCDQMSCTSVEHTIYRGRIQSE